MTVSFVPILGSRGCLLRVMHLEFDGEHYQKTYEHTFLPPSDSNSIVQELFKLCVPVSILENELQPLYQFADGIHLFHSESERDDSGRYFIPPVDLYPLARLAAETAYMQSHALDETDSLDIDPPIYSGGLVIGEASCTGNPFVLIRWGGLAGKVVYADHGPDINDWAANPFAQSLTHLLRQVALPPHPALCHLCGADRIWFK